MYQKLTSVVLGLFLGQSGDMEIYGSMHAQDMHAITKDGAKMNKKKQKQKNKKLMIICDNAFKNNDKYYSQ